MKNNTIRDFSKAKNFPGGSANDGFEKILRFLDKLNLIPDPIFLFLLFLLAFLPTYPDFLKTFCFTFFFLTDWLFFSLLRGKNRSYGPPKTQTLELAILRICTVIFPFWLIIILQILGTGLMIYGFWFEPHRLNVTYEKLSSPKLKGDTTLRVLHLGDLHLERITLREIKLNKIIKQLHPDLILFSGDMLNLSYVKDPISRQQVRHLMSEWSAPLGVYMVSGSVAVDLPEMMTEMTLNQPFQYLTNHKITVQLKGEEIDLIGLTCTHRPFIDAPKLTMLTKEANSRFTIFIYHSPDLAPNAAQTGIDLQLSGHTHGGQVRLPYFGALFAASLYGKRYEAGRYQLDSLTLYVTRGIGMEGCGAPRVRFLCPPEIILWEISGQSPPHS